MSFSSAILKFYDQTRGQTLLPELKLNTQLWDCRKWCIKNFRTNSLCFNIWFCYVSKLYVVTMELQIICYSHPTHNVVRMQFVLWPQLLLLTESRFLWRICDMLSDLCENKLLFWVCIILNVLCAAFYVIIWINTTLPMNPSNPNALQKDCCSVAFELYLHSRTKDQMSKVHQPIKQSDPCILLYSQSLIDLKNHLLSNVCVIFCVILFCIWGWNPAGQQAAWASNQNIRVGQFDLRR